MHIEFIKNHGAYSPGDVAGFDAAQAKDLVERGVATIKQWNDAPKPVAQDGADAAGQAVTVDGEGEKPARGRRK